MELILKEARSTNEKEKNMKDEKIKILCCDTGVHCRVGTSEISQNCGGAAELKSSWQS